jgi:drug/metabolite transporter (DMT)-like permease
MTMARGVEAASPESSTLPRTSRWLAWASRWLALPDNVRGAAWVVASCILLVTMSMLVKLAGARLDGLQLGFIRACFALLIVVPLAFAAGPQVFRTNRPRLHLARGLAGSIGMLCGFYALTRMPLADVTAIGFTQPLFLIVLAALVLGETVRARRWTATAIGFVGVLIMLRPGDGVLDLVALVALVGALAAAVVKLLVKRLAVSEAPLTIMVYLAVIQLVVSAIPAALVWQWPGVFELALMALAAVCSSLGQFCFIRGYRIGEASALAPFEYARLPLAALYGLLLFGEVLSPYTIAGAGLIVASTLYIARREAKLGKRLITPRTTPDV